MDLFKTANIDLAMFSPEAQRDLVTLKDCLSGIHSTSYCEVEMNGIYPGDDISISNLSISSSLIEASSTPNRKKRKQVNPKKCVQFHCKVCETNFQGKIVECQICFKMSHTQCCVNTGGNFICCLNCKNLPKVTDELRSQNKHLMMLNGNLVSLLKDKNKQFNNLLEICEKTKCIEPPEKQASTAVLNEQPEKCKPIPAPRKNVGKAQKPEGGTSKNHQRNPLLVISDSIPKKMDLTYRFPNVKVEIRPVAAKINNNKN